jgi:hypothetical protein
MPKAGRPTLQSGLHLLAPAHEPLAAGPSELVQSGVPAQLTLVHEDGQLALMVDGQIVSQTEVSPLERYSFGLGFQEGGAVIEWVRIESSWASGPS